MAQFEFIDPDGELDEAELLLERDEERGVAAPEHTLPPHASRPRLLASLLALGLLVGGVAGCFTAAYHRHETDLRIANTLDLRGTRATPSIPGLTALGNGTDWHAQVSERVVVPVANMSPKPVTVLSALLYGPGMARPAAFTPVGSAVLKPGQTGQVGGDVVVDCSANLASASSPTDVLQVRARASGGTIGTEHLGPDRGGETLKERICEQEYNLTWPTSTTATGDPSTHVISVTLSATSIADVPLRYDASALYSASPEADGVMIAADLRPLLPVTGTIQPGGTVRAAFSITLAKCPRTPPPPDNVIVQVIFKDHNAVAGLASGFIDFDVPLARACP